MTPSSPAWNKASVRRRKSRSVSSKEAQSAPSAEKSSACGSHVPRRFAFWKRRMGTDSQSRPRCRPPRWTSIRDKLVLEVGVEPTTYRL